MNKTILFLATLALLGCQHQPPENEFVVEQWPDGTPKVIELKTNSDLSITYQFKLDSLGQLREFTPLTHNKPDGSHIYFRDNAEMGAVINYVDGKREGYTYEFYPQAQIAFLGLAKDGAFNGPTAWYHENGQVDASGQRLNDKYHEEWTTYYENGQMRAKGSYSHGQANDDWTYWTETGEVIERDSASGMFE